MENPFVKIPVAHTFALENRVRKVRASAIKKLQNSLTFEQKIPTSGGYSLM
jgi:hypothetical protein